MNSPRTATTAPLASASPAVTKMPRQDAQGSGELRTWRRTAQSSHASEGSTLIGQASQTSERSSAQPNDFSPGAVNIPTQAKPGVGAGAPSSCRFRTEEGARLLAQKKGAIARAHPRRQPVKKQNSSVLRIPPIAWTAAKCPARRDALDAQLEVVRIGGVLQRGFVGDQPTPGTDPRATGRRSACRTGGAGGDGVANQARFIRIIMQSRMYAVAIITSTAGTRPSRRRGAPGAG